MQKILTGLCSMLLWTMAYSQGNARLAEQHYEAGLRFYRSGDYETALKELNRSLYLDAARVGTYLLRADVWEKLNRLESALTDVETALMLKPGSRELMFRKGLLLFGLSKWDDAFTAFHQTLRLPADETQTIYYVQQPYRKTATGLITAQSDIRSVVYNHLGLTAVRQKKCRDAIIWFDSALVVSSLTADLLVNRALAFADCGDVLSAQADLQQALRIDPNHALALHHLALLDGDNPELEERLTAAIRADSLLPDAWLERANYRLRTKDYAGAEHDYTFALKFLFTNPEIWFNRGIAREQQKNWSGAYDDFNMALSLEEDFVKAWLERGNLLHQMNRFTESIEDYSAALVYEPANPRAYFNRGLSWSKLENWENACQDFRKAEKLGMTIPENLRKKCHKSDMKQ